MHLATPLPPDFAHTLATILRALANVVANGLWRNPRHLALVGPLWSYINTAARRLDGAFARVVAGRRRLPRPSRPNRPRPTTPRRRRLFPTGRGWLVAAIGHEAVGCASQLQHLLAEREAAAALAASPFARRLLAPLQHMLGIAPPRPRHPRARQAASARPAAPQTPAAEAAPQSPPRQKPHRPTAHEHRSMDPKPRSPTARPWWLPPRSHRTSSMETPPPSRRSG